MQAAVVNVLDQPPRSQTFPEPAPGEGEVIVQVRAAGLHPIVKALAKGSHYLGGAEVPSVPGVGRCRNPRGWQPGVLHLCTQTLGFDVRENGLPAIQVSSAAGGT